MYGIGQSKRSPISSIEAVHPVSDCTAAYQSSASQIIAGHAIAKRLCTFALAAVLSAGVCFGVSGCAPSNDAFDTTVDASESAEPSSDDATATDNSQQADATTTGSPTSAESADTADGNKDASTDANSPSASGSTDANNNSGNDDEITTTTTWEEPVTNESTSDESPSEDNSPAAASNDQNYVQITCTVSSDAADGSVSASISTALPQGSTALDALAATGLPYNARTSQYSTYVAAIGGLAEKDSRYGSTCGWLYAVNGSTPSYSASTYVLNDGDTVSWYFTLR
jgi:hypothetical protein